MDVSAEIKFKNGMIQKEEFYYGASFLSQSGRFLTVDQNIAGVVIKNNMDQTRNVALN